MRLYEFARGRAATISRADSIQHHVERDNAAHLATAVRGEVELLPDPLKSRAERFVDAVNERLLPNGRFWQTATCQDAVNKILELANQHFGLSLRVPVNPDLMSGVDQELAFGLFQIATLSVSYNASTQKEVRRFIGSGMRTRRVSRCSTG